MYSILLVEDDPAIRDLLSYNLSREGFRVAAVATGELALTLAQMQSFDAVVLDRLLPGVDGLRVCRELRTDFKTRGIPILMLTALGAEKDVVCGLKEGADDYLSKPFSVKVLIARLEALLRRTSWLRKEGEVEG